jgi:hypothetical protein
MLMGVMFFLAVSTAAMSADSKHCFFSRFSIHPCPEVGKVCTDSNQCGKGSCIVDWKQPSGTEAAGYCAGNQDENGCFRYVTKGRASELSICQ